MYRPEVTGYPINGPSPVRCNNGADHHLHVVAHWAEETYTLSESGRLVLASRPEITSLDLGSGTSRVQHIVPMNKLVAIPFDTRGVPDRSRITIAPPAEISSQDAELLANVTDKLGIVWALNQYDDGTAIARVHPEEVAYKEPHGPEELEFKVQSWSVVLAGLRLLAMKSVLRRTAWLN